MTASVNNAGASIAVRWPARGMSTSLASGRSFAIASHSSGGVRTSSAPASDESRQVGIRAGSASSPDEQPSPAGPRRRPGAGTDLDDSADPFRHAGSLPPRRLPEQRRNGLVLQQLRALGENPVGHPQPALRGRGRIGAWPGVGKDDPGATLPDDRMAKARHHHISAHRQAAENHSARSRAVEQRRDVVGHPIKRRLVGAEVRAAEAALVGQERALRRGPARGCVHRGERSP